MRRNLTIIPQPVQEKEKISQKKIHQLKFSLNRRDGGTTSRERKTRGTKEEESKERSEASKQAKKKGKKERRTKTGERRERGGVDKNCADPGSTGLPTGRVNTKN